MEQVIEVGSIWIGKINRQTELEVMSFNSEKVKVKVLSNGSDVSSVDAIFYMSKDYFLKSYARQVSMEYLKGYEDGVNFGNTKGYAEGRSDACKWFEEKNDESYYKKGLEESFDKGYNTAIKEMKSNKLNSGVCGSNVPNKETQEAMQEVLDNPFIIKPSDLFKRRYFKENDKHKYPHYFKDVSELEWLDVYQLCKLFPVEDDSGAINHARKKLLVCGGRGGMKDKIKDIKEARDTLNRYLEMEGHLDD